MYSLSSYQYTLPEELVAQHPCVPRDGCRLMVVDRASGNITEMVFRDLVDFLQPHDTLICNDTRVIPARLLGARESGGATEILLTRRRDLHKWEALARPGKKLKPGSRITFGADLQCEILETLESGSKIIRFEYKGSFEEALDRYGQMPLPHYIHREFIDPADKEDYQTVFSREPGAVAAPTASLHMTEGMLAAFKAKSIDPIMLTLHVGLGTFRPVQVEDLRDHLMHSEYYSISAGSAQRLNAKKKVGGRRVCMGTTCCRTLETATTPEGVIQPGSGDTSIFIYPGYKFKYVDTLLTNFHLPGSTLLMLVSAFAGRDLIMEAYTKAVRERYRFFSYGDAMLIL